MERNVSAVKLHSSLYIAAPSENRGGYREAINHPSTEEENKPPRRFSSRGKRSEKSDRRIFLPCKPCQRATNYFRSDIPRPANRRRPCENPRKKPEHSIKPSDSQEQPALPGAYSRHVARLCAFAER